MPYLSNILTWLKFFLYGGVVAVLIIVGTFTYITWDKQHNPIVIYLEDKFHHTPSPFSPLLHQLPPATAHQTALVLGAEVLEQDLECLLEKGYNLIAVNYYSIYYDLMIPNKKKYPHQVKILSIDNFTSFSLPPLDIVVTGYVFSFYPAKEFQEAWQHIHHKIKPGGYYIGAFLGEKFNLFDPKKLRKMTFFSEKGLRTLLKDYTLLDVREHYGSFQKLNGTEHYYTVLARR